MRGLPTVRDIEDASRRIAGRIHRTPVLSSRSIDAMTGCRVVFKCENLQRAGAFKFRGATNATLALSADEASRGVATHSSGNHAGALALAARDLGVAAHVVMPTTARRAKVAAVRSYGATVVRCEPSLESRETTLRRVVGETGAVFVHPYDDAHVIAGQGTAALELLADVPDLELILVPVGGGGLLSGTALAVAAASSRSRVVGVEPAGADDARRSFLTGAIVPSVDPDTVADGLLTSLGELPFAIIRERVDDIVTVTDEAIVAAMRTVWERMKIIVEPSSAVPLAALLGGLPGATGRRVGIVLSGGNVDLDRLPWIS